MPVSAVVLSYNVPDKLLFSVGSLLVQPEIKELILIENHSKVNMDMAYARIRAMCVHSGVDFVFYRPEHALSFSDGQNWGIDHATHDLVLLMNNGKRSTNHTPSAGGEKKGGVSQVGVVGCSMAC